MIFFLDFDDRSVIMAKESFAKISSVVSIQCHSILPTLANEIMKQFVDMSKNGLAHTDWHPLQLGIRYLGEVEKPRLVVFDLESIRPCKNDFEAKSNRFKAALSIYF